LVEAKNWCRIDIADDDALITELIKSARQACEQYVNLSLINRTVTALIHNGLGNFTLPYGPVAGDVITYTDIDDTALTDYNHRDSYGSDMTVVYLAGFTVLPQKLKTAVLNQVAWMYSERGDERIAFGLSELSKLILNPMRHIS
jgi:hypothetical protein